MASSYISQYRCIYRDHLLTYQPALLDDGRVRARVTVTRLGWKRDMTERVIALPEFETEAEAVAHAKHEGMAWVAAHGRTACGLGGG